MGIVKSTVGLLVFFIHRRVMQKPLRSASAEPLEAVEISDET